MSKPDRILALGLFDLLLKNCKKTWNVFFWIKKRLFNWLFIEGSVRNEFLNIAFKFLYTEHLANVQFWAFCVLFEYRIISNHLVAKGID